MDEKHQDTKLQEYSIATEGHPGNHVQFHSEKQDLEDTIGSEEVDRDVETADKYGQMKRRYAPKSVQSQSFANHGLA